MLWLAPLRRLRVESHVRVGLAVGVDPQPPDREEGPVGGIGIVGRRGRGRPRLPPQVERVEGVFLRGVVGIELRITRLGGDQCVA